MAAKVNWSGLYWQNSWIQLLYAWQRAKARCGSIWSRAIRLGRGWEEDGDIHPLDRHAHYLRFSIIVALDGKVQSASLSDAGP